MQKDYNENAFNLTHEIICATMNKKEAIEIESELQKEYINNILCYNDSYRKYKEKQNYGFKRPPHSEETKKLISKNRKGKHVGKDNHFFGKKHTKETLSLMSRNRIGKTALGNNPQARRVKVYGVECGTVKEGMIASGYKKTRFYNRLRDPNNNDFQYVD